MPMVAVYARVALTVLACLASFGTHAQVYKWVDSKGVTHYDEKPPENTKSKEVKLRDATAPAGAPSGAPQAGGPPEAGKAAGAGNTLQDRERAFRQRQAAREEEEAKQARARARLDSQCKEARGNLAEMRQTGRMYEMNDKGERVFMSDKQREDAIAAREQEYNQNCK